MFYAIPIGLKTNVENNDGFRVVILQNTTIALQRIVSISEK